MMRFVLELTGVVNAETGEKQIGLEEDLQPTDIGTPEDYDPTVIVAVDISGRAHVLSWGKSGPHPYFSLDDFQEWEVPGIMPGCYVYQWGVTRFSDALLALPAPEDYVAPREWPMLLLNTVEVIWDVRGLFGWPQAQGDEREEEKGGRVCPILN